MRSRPLLPVSSLISRSVGGVVEVGGRVIGDYFEHRMGTYAVALAYRGLFALFPFMLLLVVLVGAFGPSNAIDRLVAEVKAQSSEQVPQQLEPVVEQGREQIQPLEDMARRAERRAEGGLLLFGVALALWSVSALSGTLADAFNNAYGLTESRPWWKVQALSLASGPLLALAVIVAVSLMLTGSRVAEDVAGILGLRELFVLLWAWLRFPVALVLLWAALSVIYRHSPAVTLPWRSVMLGAALAVLAWAVASVGFTVYLANFADFGVTYGSLGAAVGLLVYLNLSASLVLAGAELNASMHPSAADPGRTRAGELGSAE
ncbi:MAG TPA: YihY/virulence factor BrkB family protein [Rubrobacter sp.]